MKIDDFFKTIGYNISKCYRFQDYIKNWSLWYKGKVAGFHDYYIYNGDTNVKCNRASLQMAKFLCEKMADLIFNEKVEIVLGDEQSNEILKQILKENDFHTLMNIGVEVAFALGTGCITVDIDNMSVNSDNSTSFEDSNVKINFISAENIFPLSWNSSGINELAIIEYENDIHGQIQCIIKMYLLNENKNYVIRNYKFIVNNENNLLFNKDEIYTTEFDTKSNLKWFIPIMPNIVNNIDRYSPYGISIFANAIDVLRGIDISYDSLLNEIQLGRKRLFTSKELLRVDTMTGETKLTFDPSDVVFYVLGDNLGEGDSRKNYIQEVNSELRIEEHIKSLNTNFMTLGLKTGFGGEYLGLDKNGLAPKTATQVINERSDLYNSVHKHEVLLTNAMINLAKVIAHIGDMTGKFHLNTDTIKVIFDDSVFKSKDEERNQDRMDLSQDTLSRIDYVMKWYQLDEEQARLKIKAIDEEKPAKESIHFTSGEIN